MTHSYQLQMTRGAMGITISPTAHRLENGKRLPAYGVRIRVDVKRKVLVGMTAVAQWVAASENGWRVSVASRSGGTPSIPRREALYSRLQQRSVSVSPTKTVIYGRGCNGVQVSSNQPAKGGRAELRRRALLSRLERVAEVVWMFHLEVGAEKWLEMPGRSGDASQTPAEPKGAHEHGLRRARGIIRRKVLDVGFQEASNQPSKLFST
ncbi:hypothetical protein R3P38DRAFT_2812393 [Favolaschia claudopus]|uniref:Uncharacterized protein n=1 Tax=Favolaschia claudopus TaxID=2862362 RepID=A0AAV9Z7B9_9AGAR